jgi:uncharacterized protein YlxP (DUF503 family)
MIATLTFHLHLPACFSLKDKRGRIKPLMSRLRREFNVSVAEMDRQDKWSEAVIACAAIRTTLGLASATLARTSSPNSHGPINSTSASARKIVSTLSPKRRWEQTSSTRCFDMTVINVPYRRCNAPESASCA